MKNRLLDYYLTVLLIIIFLLSIPWEVTAWWSVPALKESTHHKLSEGARSVIVPIDQYPDINRFGGDISDWTSGKTDDERSHNDRSDRNDGPIDNWWDNAKERYRLFIFKGDNGISTASDKWGAYYYIAFITHLTEDMGVPAHAYNIPHGWLGAMDNLEELVAGCYGVIKLIA